jgi:hypothetical protein
MDGCASDSVALAVAVAVAMCMYYSPVTGSGFLSHGWMMMVMVIRKVVTCLVPEMLLIAPLNVNAPGNAQTSMQTYMPNQQ